jgi:hypothetical protein
VGNLSVAELDEISGARSGGLRRLVSVQVAP